MTHRARRRPRLPFSDGSSWSPLLFRFAEIRRPPTFSIADHIIEDRQQLPHGSNQRHHFWFPFGNQSSVKPLDRCVVSGRRERRHVQHSPHVTSATNDRSLALMSTRLMNQWSDANQFGDLSARELAQLGKLTDQDRGGYWAWKSALKMDPGRNEIGAEFVPT